MAHSRSLTDKLNAPVVAFFFVGLIIAGLFTTHFARTLSSFATAGLAATVIFYAFRHHTLGNVSRYPHFVGFMLLYVLHLTGFFFPELNNSQNLERDLLMKLPLVILPFAFAVLPALTAQRLKLLYYVFFLGNFLGSLYSAGYYFTNYDLVNELYKHSNVMETPTNHVRFSLMVGFAVLIGYHLIKENYYVFRPWERKLQILITVWLFIFLHMLAVRSGLVSFYAVAFLGLGYDFLFGRRYLKSFLLCLVLVLSLVAAFYTLPTFHNKFYLTIEDVNRVSDEKSAHDYSISGRVYSFRVASEVIKEHPVFGVGVANLEHELEKKYDLLYPKILERGHILPHNQFIYLLTVFGILGLVLFLLFFYYPVFRFAGRFMPLFFVHYLIITFSFLFETTLETQVGLNYSLLFILLPLWYYRSNERCELTWKNGTFFA